MIWKPQVLWVGQALWMCGTWWNDMAFIKSKAVFQSLLQTQAKCIPKGIQSKTVDRKPWWPQKWTCKRNTFPIALKRICNWGTTQSEYLNEIYIDPKKDYKKKESCNNGIWVNAKPIIVLFSYAILHLLLFEDAKPWVYGLLTIT